jgi:hypothetical protein
VRDEAFLGFEDVGLDVFEAGFGSERINSHGRMLGQARAERQTLRFRRRGGIFAGWRNG